MRENNRKPIEKCIKKLPQFTTMNVIDGQAGLVIYSSLIFYSLTIDNILNIIVLLILAGVSISMLTGDNGILTQAQRAKELTEASSEEEFVQLLIIRYNTNKKTYGEKLKNVEFNTVENTTSIIDSETGDTYGNGWYYLKPEDVKDYEFKNSYIIDYDTGEYIKFDENKHRIVTNELLCISDGLVYSADPKNMTSGDSWGDAILHNFNR